MTPSRPATGDEELKVQLFGALHSILRHPGQRASTEAEEYFNGLLQNNRSQDVGLTQINEIVEVAKKAFETAWTDTKPRLFSMTIQNLQQLGAEDLSRGGAGTVHSLELQPPSDENFRGKRSFQAHSASGRPNTPVKRLKRTNPNPLRTNEDILESKGQNEVICPVSHHSSLQEHQKCPRKFAEIKSLRSHIRNELLAHICTECSERFKNSTEKNNHQEGCRRRKENERARNLIDESEREDCKALMERGVSIKTMEEVVKRLCERRAADQCSCRLPVAGSTEQDLHWFDSNQLQFSTYSQVHGGLVGLRPQATPDSDSVSSETSPSFGASQGFYHTFFHQRSSDLAGSFRQPAFSVNSTSLAEPQPTDFYTSSTTSGLYRPSSDHAISSLEPTPNTIDGLGRVNEFQFEYSESWNNLDSNFGLEQLHESPLASYQQDFSSGNSHFSVPQSAASYSLPMQTGFNNGQVEQENLHPPALERAGTEDMLGAVQLDDRRLSPQESLGYQTQPYSNGDNRSDSPLFGGLNPHSRSNSRDHFGQYPVIRLVFVEREFDTLAATNIIKVIFDQYLKPTEASKLDKSLQKLKSLPSGLSKKSLEPENRDTIGPVNGLEHRPRQRKVKFEDREVESGIPSDINAVSLSDITKDQLNENKPFVSRFIRIHPSAFSSGVDLLKEYGHAPGIFTLLVFFLFWLLYYFAVVLAQRGTPMEELRTICKCNCSTKEPDSEDLSKAVRFWVAWFTGYSKYIKS